MIATPLRVELPPRCVLRLRGGDALRYLNGQITQDARKVVGKKLSLASCVTDAKGKLQFWIRIHALPDGTLCVEGDAEQAEDLLARIERYLIADDVEITSSIQRVVHVLGAVPDDLDGVASNRYGIDGHDVWLDENSSPPAWLLEIPPISTDELETLTIERGVPVWGAELEAGLLPAEADLEASAVSFHKGCYIGQEVISRIESAGKTPKRLCKLLLDEESPASRGDTLNLGGKAVGWITRVAPIARGGKRAALGYLKRGNDAARFDVLKPDGSPAGQAELPE